MFPTTKKVKIKSMIKIVLLAKSNLNSKEVVVCKAFIDSNISHDKFILTNNVHL